MTEPPKPQDDSEPVYDFSDQPSSAPKQCYLIGLILFVSGVLFTLLEVPSGMLCLPAGFLVFFIVAPTIALILPNPSGKIRILHVVVLALGLAILALIGFLIHACFSNFY